MTKNCDLRAHYAQTVRKLDISKSYIYLELELELELEYISQYLTAKYF